MAKIKVFEIESYTDKKTKEVSRRFIDQLTYIKHKDYFDYNKPIIGASHILRTNGKWEKWNGNGWTECEECVIVKKLKDLNKQEL